MTFNIFFIDGNNSFQKKEDHQVIQLLGLL